MLLLTLGSGAATAGEPLIITKLADAETHLLASDGSPLNASPEQRNADFINALEAAAAVRRQAVDARCRAMAAAVPTAGDARTDWEANCRYRRR